MFKIANDVHYEKLLARRDEEERERKMMGLCVSVEDEYASHHQQICTLRFSYSPLQAPKSAGDPSSLQNKFCDAFVNETVCLYS